jgi:uncharacterized membrane protein YjjB (DUF3815 family)
LGSHATVSFDICRIIFDTSSACLAAFMMSIVFSAPRRNFIWFGGNLQCKL